jgi:glycosyltransferase involved in cell wall biosynthesis
MSKRVLIIAFHYPPVKGSSGIQRTLKFSAYLRENGWEPIILSASPRAYEEISDEQMGEIPEGVQVLRPFALNTAKHLAIGGRYSNWMAQPDRWVTWWPAAVWRGMQVIRRDKPQIIMSTYPIATAHLIGLSLQRLSGLPWVADCRDSMTEPGYPTDPLTWKTNRRLESAMVGRCAKAIFTTAGTLQMYAERYPEAEPARWAIIENGYDEENFHDAEDGLVAATAAPGRPLTLVHSGVLYPQERDPRPFFAALRSLKRNGDISAASLRVLLRATGSDDMYQRLLVDAGIDDIVQLAPSISYREALREMLHADGLLLFQAAMCNHQIPAKLYEYLRAGRPILGLTDPAGNTAAAMRAAEADRIVNIADESDIETGLRAFLAGVRAGTIKGASPDIASRNSRRARTVELARLLDETVAQFRAKRP